MLQNKYSYSVNKKLAEHYSDITSLTDSFNDFFGHVSSYSDEIQNLFKDIPVPTSELEKYHKLVKSINKLKCNISVIILCKNEERCIRRCLDSILSQISSEDEVIVIDTGSDDNSLNIIKQFSSVRLITTTWEDNFSKVRNLGLSIAKKDWVFFIDADEILEKNCIVLLREYLFIIDWLNIQPITIAPTIVNHDNSIAQGVRRIIKTNSNLHYVGLVHEEIRKNVNLLGTDVMYISFDNIILYHDGYQKNILVEKNKTQKYFQSLKNMVIKEPSHPRWLYFLCRDGKSFLSKDEYEKNLLEVIDLSDTSIHYRFYKIRALSNIISYYLECRLLEPATFYLKQLKVISPNLSDVVYFEVIINYITLKNEFALMLNQLISYRQTSNHIDYGSIHANYFHIDSLIALLFFEIEEYDKAFSIYKKLEDNHVGDYFSKYLPLYELLHNHYTK